MFRASSLDARRFERPPSTRVEGLTYPRRRALGALLDVALVLELVAGHDGLGRNHGRRDRSVAAAAELEAEGGDLRAGVALSRRALEAAGSAPGIVSELAMMSAVKNMSGNSGAVRQLAPPSRPAAPSPRRFLLRTPTSSPTRSAND